MRDTSVALKALVILTLPLLSLTNWTNHLAGPLKSQTVTIPSSKAGNAPNANRAWLSNLATGPASNPTEAEARAGVVENYARLPLSFEANQGQTDPTVKFLSHGNNYDLFLTSTESVLVLDGPSSKDSAALKSDRPPAKRRRAVLRIKLAGANPNAQVEGLDEQQGKSNYFIGKDAGKWRANIANYAGVQYRSAYPGVDLIYRGNEQRIEFDFVVAAGADFRKIKLGIEGAKKMRVDADGDLVLTTSVGEVRQHKPFVYQEVDGARRAIDSRYVFSGRRQVAFEVGDYDAGKPLVIDPVLDYSTYLGGTSSDDGRSIVVDSNGEAYITGRTTSFNFPVVKGDFDTTYANSFDVFVTKLDAAGSSLVYSTYIGGNSEDSGFGIAVDSTGNAYITGSTSSSDYPTSPGAFDTTFGGGGCCPGDGFVTKLNSTGTALVYSTYLGGSSSDQGAGIAVDSSGSAYVTGSTQSTNYPTTAGAFQTTNQGGSFPGDTFITKLNDTGTALTYSTFLGGTRADLGAGIVVDALGRAFIAGSTNSVDFDITAGAFQTTFGGSTSTFNSIGDAFVTELNQTGTALVYSTYVGGAGDDGGLGIALNSAGEAFICGTTSSFNYPVTPGVVRVANGGAAKSINSAGSWAAINSGLTDSTILSFAIDPVSPATVYTGTNAGGVFKSTNGGSSWSAINSGLTNLTIKSLAIDPSTPSVIYLGTNGRGVFKSHDGGNSWNGINTGQGGSGVNALVIDPSNSSIIYAATDNGAFKTTNGGASWSGINTGLNNSFLNAMAIDPVTTGTLYAGTFGGVFITRNGGQSWTASSLNNGAIRALQVDPLAHSKVYAGGDTGVSKSTDDGVTWRGVNVGLTNRTVNCLAISSSVYAGTGNGVFKSTDGGGVWSPVSTGLAGSVVNVLAIDPVTPATLYAGTAFGSQDGFVTRLTAAGAALAYSTYLGGSNFDNSNSIAIDSADNAYVTGQTNSPNFPTTRGAFQTSGFDSDAFVTKLDATGAGLVYSTFLGGFNSDQGFGITVNSSGNAYVTGTTSSSNFPTTPNAFQTLLGGSVNNFSNDAFVAKLNQTPSLLADLRLTLTGPSGTITPGSFLTYNITVVNDGPDPAFSILITNELPPSTSFSFCNTNNGSCLGSGNTVTFSINSLAPGASVNATVFANGTCSLVDGATLTNTATVDSLTPDSNPSNNTASVSNQASNPPPTIFPTSQGFPSDGSSGAVVNVTSSNSCSWTSVSNASWINITFSTNCCSGIVSYDVAANPGPPRIGTMTIAGNTFTVTQSGAAVTTTIGVYLPSDRTFYLRNTNSPGFADVTTQYGPAGATPIVGDWNGDGVTTIGVYDPGSQTFYLRNSNTPGNADLTIQYGPPGAIPLAGDWDGNGTTTIGVYDPAARTFYLRNSNTAGPADLTIQYGPPSAVPVVGDWDGNGTTTIGVYDPAGRTFYLRNTNSAGFADLTIGYGPSGATPVVGDWDANGTVTIGVYDPASQTFYLRNSNSIGFADLTIRYGPPGATPLAGNWDGL